MKSAVTDGCVLSVWFVFVVVLRRDTGLGQKTKKQMSTLEHDLCTCTQAHTQTHVLWDIYWEKCMILKHSSTHTHHRRSLCGCTFQTGLRQTAITTRPLRHTLSLEIEERTKTSEDSQLSIANTRTLGIGYTVGILSVCARVLS